MRSNRAISFRALSVVALAVVGVVLVAGISPGATRFLTKKKALNLFYTKAQADPRYINVDEMAANANLLDGQDSTAFLGANAKASDANLLDGQDSTAFLGASAKAADAEQLDGINSTGFVRGDGEVKRGAVATPPGEGRHLFGRFNDPGPPNPNVLLGYLCPSNTANNGEVSFFNNGTTTLNVFTDNGGDNPSDFRQVPPNGGFFTPASATGDHITFQAQGGVGTIHLEVFSVHRANDCHAQSLGVIDYS